MDSNHQGDLADIFGPRGASAGSSSDFPYDYWRVQTDHSSLEHIQTSTTDNARFGQPFDPLLDELAAAAAAAATGPCFFEEETATRMDHNTTRIDHDYGRDHNETHGDDDETNMMRRGSVAHNIFSKMVQISPKSTLNDMISAANRNISSTSSSSKNCLLETNTTTLQISSPRNTGIKRRKSQAKKVVCIPAPAPANSRPTGEVVPSDLWAWRKYGQKPIKGSPFPRGYYRCSSSKGCSARKQVERSRTDPNMLVITYTSEHNHPWPTQRNALAGSTRTTQHPSKTTTSISKEPTKPPPTSANVKELLPLNHTNTTQGLVMKEELSEGLENLESYRPQLPDPCQGEDFFACLGEIGVDPLTLLLNQDFSGGGNQEGEDYNKDLDPFDFYNWNTGSHNSNKGEANTGL